MLEVVSRSVHFIIPAFRASKTIEACLNSILKQSYPNHLYTISVIENGPQDGIASVVNKYPNCTYHYNPVTGRSEARNYLLDQVRAEFIAYVDVDVELSKTWLAECLNCMTSNFCAAVTGPVFKEGQQRLDHFRRKVSEFSTNGRYNIMENPTALGGINTAAVLFRTSALKKVKGFDTSFKRSEDYELTHRLLRSGYVVRTTALATAIVYWDRSLFEYFVIRYFQMGSFAPKVHLRHGLPVSSFWKSMPVKGFKKILGMKDPLLFIGWLLINSCFVLGHQFGKWKFRHTLHWEPVVSPKRVFIVNGEQITLYEVNPQWEIVIVRNQVRLYSRRILKFVLLQDEIQEMMKEMLDMSLYHIKSTDEENLVDEMIKNQFLLVARQPAGPHLTVH